MAENMALSQGTKHLKHDFDIELARHHAKTALFDNIIRLNTELQTCKTELNQKETTIVEHSSKIQSHIAEIQDLEQQAAPIKTKHGASLAQWKDMRVTSQQIFFIEGMTTEELASVKVLANLNGALLEEQLQLSTFASAIDAERSAIQEHERSAEASKDSFQSLDMRIKNLEAELRVAETKWVENHFKDKDRVAHLEEMIATKNQVSQFQSQKLDSLTTENYLLTKANQVQSHKNICLQKDNEFVKSQVEIIEMENMITEYGCARRQAFNILDDKAESRWPCYDEQYGFPPDFVWAVFRKYPEYIKILNWHSAMKYFHFSIGNDDDITRFGLEFDTLQIRIYLSRLIKEHPGDKMLAKLEETYKATFRRYKLSVHALNRHAAAPSKDLSKNKPTQDVKWNPIP